MVYMFTEETDLRLWKDWIISDKQYIYMQTVSAMNTD